MTARGQRALQHALVLARQGLPCFPCSATRPRRPRMGSRTRLATENSYMRCGAITPVL